MLSNFIKSTLSEQIADVIRIDIFKNKLQNGQTLSEAVLTEQFGVSRGSIRDALRSLEMEGLVYQPKNGRTFVVNFTPANLEHFYNLREYFESEAVKGILLQPEDKGYTAWIEEMWELLRQSDEHLKNGELTAFTNADFEFHYRLMERSGIRIYANMWKVLTNLTRCIIEVNHTYMYSLALSNPHDTFDFHNEILNGLQRRDQDYALKQVHYHIVNTIRIYKKVLEQFSIMNGDIAE